MVATVLCDDDITYTIDPISMYTRILKRINLQILVLVMDPNSTKEKEATRNKLCQRPCCMEVRDNEYLASIIVQ